MRKETHRPRGDEPQQQGTEVMTHALCGERSCLLKLCRGIDCQNRASGGWRDGETGSKEE